MQSVSQATEIVSYVTGAQRGRANQIARALIDAGILPKSSGRAIKKISAKELLPLLAAVAMAETVSDAARVARAFIDLPLQGEAGTLSETFATIVEKREVWKQAEIEFSKQRTGYAATIRGVVRKKDGEELEVTWPFWSNPSWGHFSKTSFTISPEGIEVLRNLFVRDDIEGVHFSLSTPVTETGGAE